MQIEEVKQKLNNLLDFTVKYYGEDVSRRASNEEGCFYNHPNGNHCAIAMAVNENERKELNSDHTPIVVFRNFTIQDRFKINFLNLDMDESDIVSDILDCIQSFHDIDAFWQKERGLSPIGEAEVVDIKARIKDFG